MFKICPKSSGMTWAYLGVYSHKLHSFGVFTHMFKVFGHDLGIFRCISAKSIYFLVNGSCKSNWIIGRRKNEIKCVIGQDLPSFSE